MRTLIWDLLAFAGATSVFTGLWWIYPPAALIVLGACLVTLALFGAKRVS